MTKRMNRQEVLNRVWEHARKQNKKCVSQSGTCKYRGPKKTMCFVGALIPDSVYSKTIEEHSANALFREMDDETPLFYATARRIRSLFDEDVDALFLDRLQMIHDNYDVDNWERELSKFALIYSLVPLQ